MTDPTDLSDRLRRSALFFAAFFALTLFAAYLRIRDIEARPLHSDESVNFLFIEGLFKDWMYPYSHENYHGPLYFFGMGLGIKLIDDSVLGVRAASIFFGTLLLTGLLPLRRLMGDAFVLIAGFLLAISPSFVFHARYAIHESLLVTASLWFASSAFLLWSKFERSGAILLGAALGVMIATKETWPVTVAAVGLGLLFVGNPWPRAKRALMLRQELFLGYLIGLVVIVLAFTNGLQSGQGLREFFLAIPQWIGRGNSDVGHFKPTEYYVSKLLWPVEPELILALVAAPLLSLLYWYSPKLLEKSEHTPVRLAFLRFLLLWSLAVVGVYSKIPYKTPWLIINLTLPLVLLLAWEIWAFAASPVLLARAVGMLICFAAVFTSYRSTSRLCYASEALIPDRLLRIDQHQPYGEGNPYSYVHTSPPMLELVRDIDAYIATHPDARVLIGVDGYFPLPYYLRKHHTHLAYLKTKDPAAWKDKYEVMIVEQTVNWSDPGFTKKYYRLSDYGESNTYFKR